MKRYANFLLLWACWGFALGTLVLMGPLRWTVTWSRSQQWTESQEKFRIYILILLVVIGAFLATKATVAFVAGSQKCWLKAGVFLLPLLCASISVYAFLQPKWMNNSQDQSLGQQFTTGPYPEKDKLQALKNDGYTSVISLLHPAVIPFEPKLMADEIAAAKAVGLPVINLPLLPWLSDNTSALDSLRKLVRKTRGKVYIHCYLGKDRVNMARRIIEQELTQTGNVDNRHPRRLLDTVKAFERGPVYKLGDGVFFTPFPTNEEYVGYVLAANFRQVVSLADLSEPGAKELMEEEKKSLDGMQIPFAHFRFSATTTPAEMETIISEIKKLPKPLLIHPFFTQTKEAASFRQLYHRQGGGAKR